MNTLMIGYAVEYANLFAAGLLAGTEFIVRFGVRAPINVLDPQPQIQLRQALTRRMRVVVPIVFLATLSSGLATAWLAFPIVTSSLYLTYAGLGAIGLWMVATFAGTVPINKALLQWRAEAPPPDWQARIRQWERLDSVRAMTALGAFACFLAASAARLA